MKVLSPSKINFGLWILFKRKNGFHEIRSFIIPIDLFDEINIEYSELTRIKSSKGPKGDENIVFDVLKIMSEETGTFISADIYINKKIPIGGGLGGGSSNAASVIKAINQIYELNLGIEVILKIAEKIGADVPFFIFSKPAIVKGKGNEIREIDIKLPFHFLIHYPNFSIDTRWAYNAISRLIKNEDYKKKEEKFEKIIELLKEGKYNEALHNIENDFEKVVFKEFPDYKELSEFYKTKGALKTFLTGTGSCLVAVFENKVNININKGEIFWCKQL